LKNSMN